MLQPQACCIRSRPPTTTDVAQFIRRSRQQPRWLRNGLWLWLTSYPTAFFHHHSKTCNYSNNSNGCWTTWLFLVQLQLPPSSLNNNNNWCLTRWAAFSLHQFMVMALVNNELQARWSITILVIMETLVVTLLQVWCRHQTTTLKMERRQQFLI